MSNFNYISEVSINANDTLDIVLQKSNALLDLGATMLAFPDRARADSSIASIHDLLKLGIFEKLPPDKFLAILATRTKLPEEINDVVSKLKSQNVKNLFVVTGDPHKNSRNNFLTSLDVIPNLSKEFNVGAAVHADVVSLDRDTKKVDAGAKFLIAQACYDQNKWMEWIAEATTLGLNRKANIYQTVIPLTNKVILESIHALHDINLPDNLYHQLCGYDENTLRQYGITSALSQINQVKQNSFFSGVYVYTKEFETISQISSATFSIS